MTDILSMINRLQDTAIDFTLSGRERDRDELHAARRAILEAFDQAQKAIEALNICIEQDDKREAKLRAREAELVKALRAAEARIVTMYRGINPHANYDDDLTFAGHVSGNRFADTDEVVGVIRAAIEPSLEQE